MGLELKSDPCLPGRCWVPPTPQGAGDANSDSSHPEAFGVCRSRKNRTNSLIQTISFRARGLGDCVMGTTPNTVSTLNKHYHLCPVSAGDSPPQPSRSRAPGKGWVALCRPPPSWLPSSHPQRDTWLRTSVLWTAGGAPYSSCFSPATYK